MQNYHDAVCAFPMGYAAKGKFVDGATDAAPGWGWGAMILPASRAGPLFNAINFALAVEAAQNTTVVQSTVSPYLCPSDPIGVSAFAILDASSNPLATLAPSSYAATVGGDESEPRRGSTTTASAWV